MGSGQDSDLQSAIPHVDVELDESRGDLQQMIESICGQCLHQDGGVLAEDSTVRPRATLRAAVCSSACSRYRAGLTSAQCRSQA